MSINMYWSVVHCVAQAARPACAPCVVRACHALVRCTQLYIMCTYGCIVFIYVMYVVGVVYASLCVMRR